MRKLVNCCIERSYRLEKDLVKALSCLSLGEFGLMCGNAVVNACNLSIYNVYCKKE